MSPKDGIANDQSRHDTPPLDYDEVEVPDGREFEMQRLAKQPKQRCRSYYHRCPLGYGECEDAQTCVYPGRC